MRLTPVLLLTASICWAAPLAAQEDAPQPGQADLGAAVDRELLVRFTRAYGMAKVAFEEHGQQAPSGKKRDAMLRQPGELERDLRQEVNRILDLNGLQQDEWKMMFARMEADEDLRQRVESLSTPFE